MINKNLQIILNSLQITQTQLAKDLGMSRQQLNNILKDRGNLTLNQISKLCTLYNVNLNFLFTGVGSQFNTNSINQLKEELQNLIQKY